MTNEAPELNFEPLRQWGFAPGSYHCFCSDCGGGHTADKRAWRCLACAEKKADHLKAAVSAEREACAVVADETDQRMSDKLDEAIGHKRDGRKNYDLMGVSAGSSSITAGRISKAIRARTDADALAALEAVKRDARNVALREAAAWAESEGLYRTRDEILALLDKGPGQ